MGILTISAVIDGWIAYTSKDCVLVMVPVLIIKKDLKGPSLKLGLWLFQVKRFGLAYKCRQKNKRQ